MNRETYLKSGTVDDNLISYMVNLHFLHNWSLTKRRGEIKLIASDKPQWKYLIDCKSNLSKISIEENFPIWLRNEKRMQITFPHIAPHNVEVRANVRENQLFTGTLWWAGHSFTQLDTFQSRCLCNNFCIHTPEISTPEKRNNLIYYSHKRSNINLNLTPQCFQLMNQN